MIRDDKSKFLLFMEPVNPKSVEPINDDLTEILKYALTKAIVGVANYSQNYEIENFSKGGGWRGWHCCSCGEPGGNHEYLLENGFITNQLCIHYVQYHREEICENDWIKLKSLTEFYEK